jgi:hypothetical protein
LNVLISIRRDAVSVEQEKSKAEAYVPKYDLSLKEGQTFKINIKVCMSCWLLIIRESVE